MSSKKSTKRPKRASKNILYVVFHGELAFFEHSSTKSICVYAPVVDTHLYMAGPWLAEKHTDTKKGA